MGRWQQTHHGATGRGPARPRRASQAIAVAVTAALVAAGFAGVPAAAGTPAAAVSGFVSGSGGDPTALPWAGGGGSGTGPVHPDQAFAVVTQDTGLATSTTPTLRASSTAPGEYQFTIGDLATGAPVGQFGLSASGPSVRVPAGKLTDGTAYQWSVTAPDGSVAGPFVFRVDTARAGRQATDAAAGVTVALATGAVQTGWTSQKVSSAAGDLSIGLAYDPAHPATPGLPDGWTLSAGSASPYTSLTVQPGGAVDLHQVDGATVTYQAAIGQSYQPVWGTGRQAPTGALSTLAHNADNTWTITDPGGTTTLFAAADAQPGTPATAGITAVSGTGGLGFGQTWTNGRLTTITDPASGRQVTLQYGPGSAQPDGFVAAPDGMLSGVTFWDGTHARVLYVPGPGGTVQIGRLIADSDAGAAASVTDYGWDYAGRLSVLRAPAAASVLAAGLPGYSDVSTHLGYDDQGRVTAVQAPAAGPGTSAVTRHYAYAATPAADGTLTTTITQDGATPPAGFVERVATRPRHPAARHHLGRRRTQGDHHLGPGHRPRARHHRGRRGRHHRHLRPGHRPADLRRRTQPRTRRRQHPHPDLRLRPDDHRTERHLGRHHQTHQGPPQPVLGRRDLDRRPRPHRDRAAGGRHRGRRPRGQLDRQPGTRRQRLVRPDDRRLAGRHRRLLHRHRRPVRRGATVDRRRRLPGRHLLRRHPHRRPPPRARRPRRPAPDRRGSRIGQPGRRPHRPAAHPHPA